MKIRILSDLHADLNEPEIRNLRPSRHFTIFAGDTSGDPRLTVDVVNRLAPAGGIVVAGNHLVYNKRQMDIQSLRDELAAAFPPGGKTVFLDPLVGRPSEERNGVLFVGGTMYTDYRLAGTVERGMDAARPRFSGGMNDFHWGKVSAPEGERFLKPEDYRDWNKKSVDVFDDVLSSNERGRNLPVVMVTHHAPLAECLDPQCNHGYPSPIDASYASDMFEFINSHLSIRAWIYGHTHSPKCFGAIRRCADPRVVLVNNAHGYASRFENAAFRTMCVLDTDTWKVVRRGKPKIADLTPQQIAILSCFI